MLVVGVDGELGADEADIQGRFGDYVAADVPDEGAVGDGAADGEVEVGSGADGVENDLVVLELALDGDGFVDEVGVLFGEGAGKDVDGEGGVGCDGLAFDGPGEDGGAIALSFDTEADDLVAVDDGVLVVLLGEAALGEDVAEAAVFGIGAEGSVFDGALVGLDGAIDAGLVVAVDGDDGGSVLIGPVGLDVDAADPSGLLLIVGDGGIADLAAGGSPAYQVLNSGCFSSRISVVSVGPKSAYFDRTCSTAYSRKPEFHWRLEARPRAWWTSAPRLPHPFSVTSNGRTVTFLKSGYNLTIHKLRYRPPYIERERKVGI